MAKRRNPKSLVWSWFEQAITPVYFLDHEHRLRHANDALWMLIGQDFQDLLGEDLREVAASHAEPRQRWMADRLLPHSLERTQDSYQFKLVLSQERETPPDDPESEALAEAVMGHRHWQATVVSFPGPDASGWMVHLEPEVHRHDRNSLPTDHWHEKWLEFRRQFRPVDPPLCLLGESATAGLLREQVRVAAAVDVNVQIVAPEGSNEDELGRHLHAIRSDARSTPLVELECTLLDAELLQTTLRELIRSAKDRGEDTGTLLLLNVDRLVATAQQELLHLLSFPQVLFNTIVTTRKPLVELANGSEFSLELAKRLAVLRVDLPGLSERTGDLPLMIHGLMQEANLQRLQPVTGFSSEAYEQLSKYDWPRNHAQLHEVVELSTAKAAGPLIEVIDLPAEIRREIYEPDELSWRLEPLELDAFLQEVELVLIEHALQQSRGNKTKAAQLIGMTRAKFHRRFDAIQGETGEAAGDDS